MTSCSAPVSNRQTTINPCSISPKNGNLCRLSVNIPLLHVLTASYELFTRHFTVPTMFAMLQSEKFTRVVIFRNDALRCAYQQKQNVCKDLISLVVEICIYGEALSTPMLRWCFTHLMKWQATVRRRACLFGIEARLTKKFLFNELHYMASPFCLSFCLFVIYLLSRSLSNFIVPLNIWAVQADEVSNHYHSYWLSFTEIAYCRYNLDWIFYYWRAAAQNKFQLFCNVVLW